MDDVTQHQLLRGRRQQNENPELVGVYVPCLCPVTLETLAVILLRAARERHENERNPEPLNVSLTRSTTTE